MHRFCKFYQIQKRKSNSHSIFSQFDTNLNCFVCSDIVQRCGNVFASVMQKTQQSTRRCHLLNELRPLVFLALSPFFFSIDAANSSQIEEYVFHDNLTNCFTLFIHLVNALLLCAHTIHAHRIACLFII